MGLDAAAVVTELVEVDDGMDPVEVKDKPAEDTVDVDVVTKEDV